MLDKNAILAVQHMATKTTSFYQTLYINFISSSLMVMEPDYFTSHNSKDNDTQKEYLRIL